MAEQHLARAQAGDAFLDKYTAQAFNIFADSAEDLARLKKQFAAGGPPQAHTRNPGIVTIRNDTGGDLDRYAVVGLGDPIIDNTENLPEFQGRVTFQGETPDIDLHRGKFGILIEPLPDGGIGKALVSGVCQVQLNVISEDDWFADIADGVTATLATGSSGAEILWKESGTGSRWGIVRLGQATIAAVRQFELKDALSPGSNATAYLRVDGTTDTGFEFEVYDVLGKYRGRARGAYADPHDDGSFGEARFNPDSGHWEIVALTPHALMIYGVTVAAVVSTAGHFHITVASTAVMQPSGGIICDQDPAVSGGMQIDNTFDWDIDISAPVVAVWDESADLWRALQVLCPAPV